MSTVVPLGTTLSRGLGSVETIHWPLRRASDVFELRYGKALVEKDRRPGVVPVYGTNGQTGTHDTPLFSGPGVVVGRKGMGHLGVEWSDGDYWVIDTAYSLRTAADTDLKFAYYLVRHVGLDHLKHGTSNPSLTRDAFGAQLFPIPPLSDQRAIAATLGALDNKIESNRRSVALALALLDAIAEREAARLPRVRLGAVARLAKTIVRPLALGDETVHHFSIPAFDSGARPEMVAASTVMSNKTGLDGPAVLVSRLNPRFNRTWWVDPDPTATAFASPEYAVLRAATRGELAGVWLAVRDPAFRDELPMRVTGTSGSHQRIRPEDLLSIPVPDARLMPEVTLQGALAVLNRVDAIRIELDSLVATRDALLPELLSGRIRVPVEEAAA